MLRVSAVTVNTDVPLTDGGGGGRTLSKACSQFESSYENTHLHMRCACVHVRVMQHVHVCAHVQNK